MVPEAYSGVRYSTTMLDGRTARGPLYLLENQGVNKESGT
jgi:hypothetical protein